MTVHYLPFVCELKQISCDFQETAKTTIGSLKGTLSLMEKSRYEAFLLVCSLVLTLTTNKS